MHTEQGKLVTVYAKRGRLNAHRARKIVIVYINVLFGVLETSFCFLVIRKGSKLIKVLFVFVV